jgi:hypothetical protein
MTQLSAPKPGSIGTPRAASRPLARTVALFKALYHRLHLGGRMLPRRQPRSLPLRRCDEPGDTTSRDPGLDRPLSAFHLADIHPGIESARLQVFVLTGQYWRGT